MREIFFLRRDVTDGIMLYEVRVGCLSATLATTGTSVGVAFIVVDSIGLKLFDGTFRFTLALGVELFLLNDESELVELVDVDE